MRTLPLTGAATGRIGRPTDPTIVRQTDYSNMAPSAGDDDLPPGTLELLVLRALSIEPMHGYAIGQYIERLSDAVLRIEKGSLYPALDRVQRQGWATAEWRMSPTGRRARYYTITASGRRKLGEKRSAYDRISGAINRVLDGT